jgi:hypothetical protein
VPSLTRPPGDSRTSSRAVPALAAVVACFGCGGDSEPRSDGFSGGNSSATGGVLVADDFSAATSGWKESDDADALLAYADGGYRILLKTPGPGDARLDLGSPDDPVAVEAVRVEADVTERAGPYTTGQGDPYEFHGVTCWDSEGQGGYKFVLTPEGHYGILKDDLSDDGLVTLAEGETAFDGYGATNRIGGECRARADGSTLLVLRVENSKIAEAVDIEGPERFGGVGLTAESSEAGTDVFFDNFHVRNPLAGTPATGVPLPGKNQAPPPNTRSAPSSSAICKKAGIRFLGSTAQGGEVCFTLAPDRRTVREVGFAFVPGSGCPERATGTVYAQGDGGPSVTGDEVRSSGFTGTFRGERAWGVLQDWDICKERTFAWQAGRVR